MDVISQPLNRRSRATREALLRATRRLLERDGFDALTLTAIAAEAGVSRRGAYLHFGSVDDVVAELFDHVAAAEGLVAVLDAIAGDDDVESAFAVWCRHLARYHLAVAPVDRAMRAVQARSPAAAAHLDRVRSEQRNVCERLVRLAKANTRLGRGWTSKSATDVLYGLIATDLMERLIVDCGWSEAQLTIGMRAFSGVILRPKP